MAIGQSSRAKLVIARFGTVEVSAFKITYYNILLSETNLENFLCQSNVNINGSMKTTPPIILYMIET